MAHGDGTNGTTGIARDDALTRHLCIEAHRYRLDGIDGRQGVSTSLHTGGSGFGDMCDVGRHLRNDGNADTTLHALRILLHQLGNLTDIAAHALVLHLRT